MHKADTAPPSRRRRAARGRATLWIALAAIGAVAVGAVHNVAVAPTDADRAAAAEIMGPQVASLAARPATYEQEIEAILRVQDAVLSAAPENEGIPLGQPREPGDLRKSGAGLCYDRSRAIEKLLRLAGFETRHVSIYAVAEGATALGALLRPQNPSHAVSEVLTRRGWLLVDSNRRWIGLAADGNPVSVAALAETQSAFDQSERVGEKIDPIFTAGFTYLYGLYSRHGRFYAPYTPIPDVNWLEFADNLL